MGHLDRRAFLKLAGVTGAAGLAKVPGAMPLAHAADEAAPNAPAIITGKSPQMIVHNAKLGVMETPLALLREQRFTPKEILYNRQHFPVNGSGNWVATLAPMDASVTQEWTIFVSGLVQRPRRSASPISRR